MDYSFHMKQQGPIYNLIRMLSTLPSLGNRSARRIALHLLTHKEEALLPLANALREAAESVQSCAACGNLDLSNPCQICSDEQRDTTAICVVAQVSDLWAIERTGSFKGRYHVLGGLLSALDGVGPADLRIGALRARVEADGVQEVILALSATVDGQSTAHYITDQLEGLDVPITHLAHGVPVGGELDYMDDGTIITALKSRKAG